jgi:hypothetical protein
VSAFTRTAILAVLVLVLSQSGAFAAEAGRGVGAAQHPVSAAQRAMSAVRNSATEAASLSDPALAMESPSPIAPSSAPNIARSTDDEIPGIELYPGTTNESVDSVADPRDVYRVFLENGARLLTVVTHTSGAGSTQVRLLAPQAAAVDSAEQLAGAVVQSDGTETLTYTAQNSGYYYLDVAAIDGYSDYSLSWRISGAPSDNIPGVTLTPSPAGGWLDGEYNWDDVYAVAMQAGDTLDMTLVSTPDPWSFDNFNTSLYVYGVSATNIYASSPLTSVGGDAQAKTVRFVAPASGRYFVDVYAGMGSGSYALRWSIAPKVASVMVLTPAAKSRTFRRSGGTASFKMASRLSDRNGAPLAGCSAVLQVSPNGRTWKTDYRGTTNAAGATTHVVSMKRAGTQYYRWSKPATANNPAAVTPIQKVVIK